MKTLGQRIVNNGNYLRDEDTRIGFYREQFAKLIDELDEIRSDTTEGDVKRLASIAISKLEEACMFTIKTLTYDK